MVVVVQEVSAIEVVVAVVWDVPAMDAVSVVVVVLGGYNFGNLLLNSSFSVEKTISKIIITQHL